MRETFHGGSGREARRGVTARRRSPKKSLPRSDSERIAAVAAEADVPVEDVLREVADFRLALETDMIIAAAAVDSESPELLSDVLDGERAELASFHDRLLERLADAAADDEVAVRRQRRVAGRPSRLVAAAAAVIALVGGGRAVMQGHGERHDKAVLAAADKQYVDLSSAVTGASSPTAVRTAAQHLHQTLKTLINEHASDPEVAQHTAELLRAEISLLEVRAPDSQVLAQVRTLIKLLKGAVPTKVRASVAPILDTPTQPRATTAAPKTSPSPSAKASSKPSPSPSPKPSSSPSPSQNGPLHTP